MKFMSAYKYLDMICRDMNDIGVSGYIEDMEKNPQGAYTVIGWQEDYRNLKHYRWIRNQIAHEIDVEEEDLCTQGDIEWIEDFYNRIMDCTDPLACYASTKRENSRKQSYSNERDNENTKEHKSNHCLRWIILSVITVSAVVYWLFLRGV